MKINIKKIEFQITELNSMKKYPSELFYIGNTKLLQLPKISIIGSRSPNQYCRQITAELSFKLSQAGICIVSGGAMGVDAIAHKSASSSNTIMVAATGLDKQYPVVNKTLIQDIEKNGLILSQFKEGSPSAKYNFPLRNEIVVALGDILIVAYADINSGSMRSIEYALKMKKKIYVLPHRIGESNGTNNLLNKGLATAIYNIDEFILKFSKIQDENGLVDEFLVYCQTNPVYDEALTKYGAKVFEYELNGKINIENGIIKLT